MSELANGSNSGIVRVLYTQFNYKKSLKGISSARHQVQVDLTQAEGERCISFHEVELKDCPGIILML